MSTDTVICCFKNLQLYPNASTHLARNLNKLLETAIFDELKDADPNNKNHEIVCTRAQAEYIQLKLGHLLTTMYRSIWFTYRNHQPDYSRKLTKGNSWTVSHQFGSMLSYDTFASHTPDNPYPDWIRVEKDARGRVKNFILENKHTHNRMKFALDRIHPDILFKYGEQDRDDRVHLIFMLKGSPTIEKQNEEKTYSRVANGSPSARDIHQISLCSDVYVQFTTQNDAWNFLNLLPIDSGDRLFTLNFAIFQIKDAKEIDYKSKLFDDQNFSSIIGYYSMIMLQSLGYLFEDKYRDDLNLQERFIAQHRTSSEGFYQLCCQLWSELQKNHCCSVETWFNFNQQQIQGNYSLPVKQYRVPHVVVTPLKILFQPMHVTQRHRAMRKFGQSHGWMLVYFRDETNQETLTNLPFSQAIRGRYGNVLEEGLRLTWYPKGEINYHCFGSSGSQSKKGEMWFLAVSNTKPFEMAAAVHRARLSLGNTKEIQNVATFISRVGLYLTTSKSTGIQLEYINTTGIWHSIKSKILYYFRSPSNTSPVRTKYIVSLIDDIERNGYCFTDGVGTIGLGLAREVAISIGIKITRIEDIPSAYQIRLAGCKGMLSIDPRSTMNDFNVKIRKSMMKFDSDNWTLDIVDHSRMMCLSLNNQVIRLLCDSNGANRAVIESLQSRCILLKKWHPPENMYLNVFDTLEKDQIKDKYRQQGYRNGKDLLLRNKIPLPVDEARYLFGIADETELLEKGQCFIQYQTMDKKTFKIVKGDILVTKNPCLHVGDFRRLKAVNIPLLSKSIRDCIVFPTRGKRSHFNEISGSDLDGDQYWVYWGDELKIDHIAEPLSYSGASKAVVPQVTSSLINQFILDRLEEQASGIICNTHSVIADKHRDGTKSKECEDLAELFSRAIDSGKTGEKIDMRLVSQLKENWCDTYPTWMMSENKPTYESKSINGYLFNRARDLRLEGPQYSYIFHDYDKINVPTKISIPESTANDNATNFVKYPKTSRFHCKISRRYYLFVLVLVFYLSITTIFSYHNLSKYSTDWLILTTRKTNIPRKSRCSKSIRMILSSVMKNKIELC